MDLLRDDRNLLDAFRRGDESALEQVYFAYARGLFLYLQNGFTFCAGGQQYRFHGYRSSWQLEDAVQEVFLRVFREEARLAYDGVRPFKAYLMTVARHRVMDVFRKERLAFLDVSEIDDINDSKIISEAVVAAPDQQTGENELRKHVTNYIERLSPDLRRFFHARFVESESLEEVCRELGLTDYRAKQHEKQIKKQFFAYMQERGYFTGYAYRGNGVEKMIIMLLCMGRG